MCAGRSCVPVLPEETRAVRDRSHAVARSNGRALEAARRFDLASCGRPDRGRPRASVLASAQGARSGGGTSAPDSTGAKSRASMPAMSIAASQPSQSIPSDLVVGEPDADPLGRAVLDDDRRPIAGALAWDRGLLGRAAEGPGIAIPGGTLQPDRVGASDGGRDGGAGHARAIGDGVDVCGGRVRRRAGTRRCRRPAPAKGSPWAQPREPRRRRRSRRDRGAGYR